MLYMLHWDVITGDVSVKGSVLQHRQTSMRVSNKTGEWVGGGDGAREGETMYPIFTPSQEGDRVASLTCRHHPQAH